MFKRVTITDVPCGEKVEISVTLAVPDGWEHLAGEQWRAFCPAHQRSAGFALLMTPRVQATDERLLTDLDGVTRYLSREMPELETVSARAFDEDVFAPYELVCFKGRVEGVDGRLMLMATAVSIEGVNFALFGFSRDEHFGEFGELFQRMIMSFQPLVQMIP